MNEDCKWYKVGPVQMYLDKPTADLLKIHLSVEEFKGAEFFPKAVTISYDDAVKWLESGKNGELDLDLLFQYM